MNRLNSFSLEEILDFPDEPHPNINYIRYNDKLDVLYMDVKGDDVSMLKIIVKELRTKFLESIFYVIDTDFSGRLYQLPDEEKIIMNDEDNEKSRTETVNNRHVIYDQNLEGNLKLSLNFRMQAGPGDILDRVDTFGLHIDKYVIGTDGNFEFNEHNKVAIWKLIYNVFYYNLCDNMINYPFSDKLLTIPLTNTLIQIDILKSILSLLHTNRSVDNFGKQLNTLTIGEANNNFLIMSTLSGYGINLRTGIIDSVYSYNKADCGGITRRIIENYTNNME